MRETSEQINLEYIVTFQDGLRPRVVVYGIEPGTEVVYAADAFISVSVIAGLTLELGAPLGEEDKRKDMPSVYMKAGLCSSIVWYKEGGKFSRDGEQEVLDECKKNGWNLIKVQNPEHLEWVVRRHVELYAEQFKELAETFKNSFEEFMEEHPGYGNY